MQVAFTAALLADAKGHLLDEELLAELASGVVPDNDERVPVLLAVSDNGPQMTSKATAVFMAGARIAQHFGRPATPTSRARTRTWPRSSTPASWRPNSTAAGTSTTPSGSTKA